MPVIDVEKMNSAIEPIEICLNGQRYTVKCLDAETMKRMADIERDSFGSGDLHGTLARQVGALTGEPAEAFVGNDVRQLKAIVSGVMKAIAASGEPEGDASSAK